MTITKEDIELIEKFIDIRDRGYFCSGEQVTTVYNRVLNKNLSSTNCSTCIRHRITELENALNQFKELAKETPVEDEIKPVKKKAGRPKRVEK